ncbi:MAG TPA: histidine kinase [Tepidisphaeraceae bacterium]|nr:histidine kinase [Tepidisphaeraceae bacterium]
MISWLNGRRRRVEGELRQAHQGLERRVEERTAELSAANQRLQQEVIERRRAEQEILAQQEQLRELASELSRVEERQLRHIAAELHDGIGQLLAMAEVRLDLLQDRLIPPDPGGAEGQGQGEDVAKMFEEVRGADTIEITRDVLNGSAGDDWFIWDTNEDKIVGLSSTEDKVDINNAG